MQLNSYLLRSTVVAALGGLLFGFDTVVISGTTQALTDVYHLSPFMLGMTVATALVGTIVGSMFAGIPGDRFGRRDSLRILAVMYAVSAIGCVIAWDWYSVLAARVIGGLAIGASSVLGPMYIAEVAPAQWRGRLVGIFQFNIVMGILAAYLSNYIVGQQGLGAAEWRWKFGVAALPAAFFLIALFFIPRSPRWLAVKQRTTEALDVLRKTGAERPDWELAEIVASIDAEHGHAHEPLFSAKYRKPILLAVGIAFFNQMLGVNAILYYLNDIFARAGFNKVSSDLQAVAIGLTNLIATILAMTLIDKAGRRTLLLIGSVGCAASLGGVAWIFATDAHPELLVWLLVGFIASFAFSQGAVIWVYISEIFPNRVRASGQSLGCFTHWFMNAGVSLLFPVVAHYSRAFPFVVFSVIAVVQFFVVLAWFPETRGVSLEQMQKKMGIA
jgi:MFS transporter, SP family, arabinose:H+ symporter